MGGIGEDERPFVGRRDELRRFDEILTAPEGQAVLVVGQAGMGKTMLLDRMARCARDHPELNCGAVQYEVTPSNLVAGTMELMIEDAFAAAQVVEGSLEDTDRRRGQWFALLGLLPRGGQLGELIRSLRRDPAKDTRTQFMDRLRLISAKMPADARVVFMVDPDKHMQPDSQDDWRLVVRDLPERINFVFAQRPEDVLISSRDFCALPNVRRIPDDRLDVLDEAAVEDLLALRRDDLKVPLDEVRPAIARYAGHPYAVPAALDLIADGLPVEDLPGDPTPEHIAEAQWNQVCDRHGRDAIELFRALAVLEVAVPDEVFRHVSRLDSTACAALLANAYLGGLLRREENGRRIYHALLADHIRGQVSEEEAKPYHQRAVEVYRQRLKAEARADALAAIRLPEHVLAAEGPEAFVDAFVNECTVPLSTLGLLDAALALSHRALREFVLEGSAAQAAVCGNLGSIYFTRGDLDGAERMFRKALEINEQLRRLEGMAAQCGNLGAIHKTRGDLEEAERMFRKALQTNEQLGCLEGVAAQYGNLGVIYETRADVDEAEKMHRKALEIDERLGRLAGMAGDYAALAVVCCTRGDLDEAERMHRKSLQINEQLGRVEGMANQYGHLGLIYQTRGDLDEAERMHRKALAINEKLGRLEGMAKQYGDLGVIYQKRGDLDEAERMHRKALEIEERLGHLEGMASDYCNLGLLYHTRGDLDAAEAWHCKGLAIEEQLARLRGMARQYGNLGLIFETRGDLDEAERMYRKSLKIQKKLGDLEGMTRQYANLGLIYQTRGDLDEAEKMHRKSLEIEEKLGHLEGTANAYGNLGLIYQTRGDLDEAERRYRKALEIDEKLGRLEGTGNAYGNLGLICGTRGDLDEAERMLRKALEIDEQLGSVEGMGKGYGSLGLIHAMRGELGQARELWIKARHLYAQIGMPHMVEEVQGWIDRLANGGKDSRS